MSSTYTIVMTKGSYVVRQEDAERVLLAVEQNEPHVFVSADLTGHGTFVAGMRLIVPHIVAVTENGGASQTRRLTLAYTATSPLA